MNILLCAYNFLNVDLFTFCFQKNNRFFVCVHALVCVEVKGQFRKYHSQMQVTGLTVI